MNFTSRFSDLARVYPNAAVGIVCEGQALGILRQLRRDSINNSTAANPVGSGARPFLSTNFAELAQLTRAVLNGTGVGTSPALRTNLSRGSLMPSTLREISSAVERAECNLQGPSSESRISLLCLRSSTSEQQVISLPTRGLTPCEGSNFIDNKQSVEYC
jgi:hypothetical protein